MSDTDSNVTKLVPKNKLNSPENILDIAQSMGLKTVFVCGWDESGELLWLASDTWTVAEIYYSLGLVSRDLENGEE